ncbi:hypothetical protein ACVWWI_006254 [Bradyrhizobium sp. USDA 3686]|uniref:hypothetical protein n=1 Tax=Bradyrhizobium canariense TaxID=255045 RepID=UPI00195A4F02|nr:hypothetical protein [Bradyrhizobium canariense]
MSYLLEAIDWRNPQHPAPFHVLARGWAGPSLLAMVLLGDGLQHPHPLSQEAIYATLPLTPRQRLRSIPVQKPVLRQSGHGKTSFPDSKSTA